MVDLHTHVLPSVDDGSDSITTSVAMIKMAEECGVTTIVTTPHSNMEGIYENYYSESYEQNLNQLRQALKEENIHVKLIPGMEIFASEEVLYLLQQGKLITINHSRYPLIEFSFREDYLLIDYMINEMIESGMRPMIAHPERYPYVQRNPDIISRWVERGCFMQMNKGSILGGFGQRARMVSHYLLDQNLVACIASDAHGIYHRTTYLKEVHEYITKRYSHDYANLLLSENPNRVLEDKELLNLRLSYKTLDW